MGIIIGIIMIKKYLNGIPPRKSNVNINSPKQTVILMFGSNIINTQNNSPTIITGITPFKEVALLGFFA